MDVEQIPSDDNPVGVYVNQTLSLRLSNAPIFPPDLDVSDPDKYVVNQFKLFEHVKEQSGLYTLHTGFYFVDDKFYSDSSIVKLHQYKERQKNRDNHRNGNRDRDDENSTSSTSSSNRKRKAETPCEGEPVAKKPKAKAKNTKDARNNGMPIIKDVNAEDLFSKMFESQRSESYENNTNVNTFNADDSQHSNSEKDTTSAWQEYYCECELHKTLRSCSTPDDVTKLPRFRCMATLMRVHYEEFFERLEQPKDSQHSFAKPPSIIFGIRTTDWDRAFADHAAFKSRKHSSSKDTGNKYPCSWLIGKRLSEILNNISVDYIFPRRDTATAYDDALTIKGNYYASKSHYNQKEVTVPRVIPIWYVPIIVSLYADHEVLVPNNPLEISDICMNQLDNLVGNQSLKGIDKDALDYARGELRKTRRLLMEMIVENSYLIKQHFSCCHSVMSSMYDLYQDLQTALSDAKLLRKELEESRETIRNYKNDKVALESKIEDLESKCKATYANRYTVQKMKESFEQNYASKESLGLLTKEIQQVDSKFTKAIEKIVGFYDLLRLKIVGFTTKK